MRPLSEATSRIAGKSFERKYIALGRIVKCWNDIMGESFAAKAQPVKIEYRKKKDQKNASAILEIATSTADATLLHYQKDLILQRINQIFGEAWISGIRFVSLPANEGRKRRKRTLKPLTADEKKDLSVLLETIPDPDMKDRLLSLGQAILLDKD